MKVAKRNAIIIGIVVLVVLVAGFILAGIFGLLLDVLYISLIVLAAFTLVSTFYLIYAIWVLIRTITTVRDEVKPLLASVEQTVGIVRNTAMTAGQTASTIGSTAQLAKEFAVAPTVRAVAGLMAVQQMMRIFVGKGRTETRHEQRIRQQMEAGAGGE